MVDSWVGTGSMSLDTARTNVVVERTGSCCDYDCDNRVERLKDSTNGSLGGPEVGAGLSTVPEERAKRRDAGVIAAVGRSSREMDPGRREVLAGLGGRRRRRRQNQMQKCVLVSSCSLEALVPVACFLQRLVLRLQVWAVT
jgi:hypothetical protein